MAGGHGKVGMYTWGGCRCDECRRAERDRRRELRHAARDKDPRATEQCIGCGHWFLPPHPVHHIGGIAWHERFCEAFA